MNNAEIDWLDEFLGSLPIIEDLRRSIFDIADISHKETVYSNLLAYFLDPGEEHGLAELFLRSLLEVLPQDDPFDSGQLFHFTNDYSVSREYSTRGGGRIDLVLTSHQPHLSGEVNTEIDNTDCHEWAILIENKIQARVCNPLEDYWESVDADRKIGIVLSIRTEDSGHHHFSNVLHRDYANKVQKNLSDYFLNIDGRHLFLLKEYFFALRNISVGLEEKAMTDYEDTLRKFQEKGMEIEKLHDQDRKLHRYISAQVSEAFSNTDFSETSERDSARGRHFRHHDKGNDIAQMFQFYVNIDRLKYKGVFFGSFELYGSQNTIYADQLKQRLAKDGVFSTQVNQGLYGKVGANYCQIFSFNLPCSQLEKNTQESLNARIAKLLEKHLLRNKGPIFKALEITREITTLKKS